MAKVVRITAEALAEELTRLEQEHQMSAADFFARWQAGEVPETDGFMRWSWLCSLALRRGILTTAAVPA